MNTITKRGFKVNPHSTTIGYILWIFGFIGAHRFYYGKRISGTIYAFTFGLFFIGWFIDLFLIPGMDAEADLKYVDGPYEYNVSWILLTFLGAFGIHRLLVGKWVTALIYFFTGGLVGIGIIYDLWTWNQQVSELNTAAIRG